MKGGFMRYEISGGSGRLSTNAGKVKTALLLALAGVFLFLLFTTDAPESTAADCDCNVCHGDHHGPGWAGCSSCHDSPPQTGTHRRHYDSASLLFLSYGDTSVTSTPEAYKFGCGNCHPLDNSKHADGTLQVELYNANSPEGSIKAKHPSTAAYTPGTTITSYPHKVAGQPDFSWSDGSCSNVYCHSGYTYTSGPVGAPLEALGRYILDQTCNLTYEPYTVNYQRIYKTTPAWGTAGDPLFTACTACHDFPLNTEFPDNLAGVGDSHQYIDSNGQGNIHGINMSTTNGPVLCRTCHYGTVTTVNTTHYEDINGNPGGNIAVWDPVPLASRATHVNGAPNVVFDMINNISYSYIYTGGTWTFTLSNPTYDPATKTCSNVACHFSSGHRIFQNRQQKVVWGRPARMTVQGECDSCHRLDGRWPACTPAP